MRLTLTPDDEDGITVVYIYPWEFELMKQTKFAAVMTARSSQRTLLNLSNFSLDEIRQEVKLMARLYKLNVLKEDSTGAHKLTNFEWLKDRLRDARNKNQKVLLGHG